MSNLNSTLTRSRNKTSTPTLIWQPATVEGVWIGHAAEEGPTVGIMGGVHGDERAGVEFIRSAKSKVKIKRGTVVLMLGNLKAIKNHVRYKDINLNRHFNKHEVIKPLKSGKEPYEANRVEELIPFLDMCEAVLDLHEYNNPKDKPFIICERDSMKTALKMGAPIISFGWCKSEHGGSDDYMHSQGKQGICYELGARRATAKDVHLADKVVPRFLAAHGLTDAKLPPLFRKPMLVQTLKAVIRAKGQYKLGRSFKSFEKLIPGELIAVNGAESIYAEPGQVIIFPEPDAPVGDEAFLLGAIVNN